MLFEWNADKAAANQRKHGVSFAEAASVFLDPMALTFADPDHSDVEDREITIGTSASRRILLLSHCMRQDRMRLISARKATLRERKQYEACIHKTGER